jgi:type III restriction enzyme
VTSLSWTPSNAASSNYRASPSPIISPARRFPSSATFGNTSGPRCPKRDVPRAGQSIHSIYPPNSKPPSKPSTATTPKTFDLWKDKNIPVSPCFTVVCNNTSTSKLVYDYIRTKPRRLCRAASNSSATSMKMEPPFVDPAPSSLIATTGIRRSPRRQLPRHGRPRTRTVSPRKSRTFWRPPRRRIRNRPGNPPRSHEHRRQTRPPLRIHPLRRLRLHANRRLGRQYRHPRPRRARFRYPTPLRTSHRPCLTPPVLRTQRRHLFNVEYADVLGIPFNFNAEPVIAPPQVPRKTTQVKAVRPRTRPPRNPLPPRPGLSRRTPNRIRRSNLHRRFRLGTHPRSHRPIQNPQRRHYWRGH